MKIILLITNILFITNIYAAEGTKRVFISQLVEHPALDTTVKGIVDGLEHSGYIRGVNLDLRIESAQASTALASQIAAKFVSKNPDVVVGVATIAAQSFAKYARDQKIKLVFSSVTDPLKAELVRSISSPGNNTTGVSNFIGLEQQIELFLSIQPKLKSLGFIYNAMEVNSLTLIEKLKEICSKYKIVLVLQTANKTSEVAQAATKLAAHVDAIFISNDSTALSALRTIITAATRVKIPVYVSDTDAVKLGALAALGPNQYDIGLQTASIIVRALKGENLGTIPVEFPNNIELYLNESAAQELGIQFTSKLKATAKIVATDQS